MRRRDFIMLIGGAALARPVAAQAQRPARIGFLGFGTAAATADRVEALRAGLRDLGRSLALSGTMTRQRDCDLRVNEDARHALNA